MAGGGQISSELIAWPKKNLEEIESILRRQICFKSHCHLFKYLVTHIESYVWLCWEYNLKNETQQESAMSVATELLGVLKRGLQLLHQCAKEDFRFIRFGRTGEFFGINDDEKKDFAYSLFMIFGITGLFREIIDDVKKYCQMMNNLLLRQVDTSKGYNGDDIKNLQRIVEDNWSSLKSKIPSSYEEDKIALIGSLMPRAQRNVSSIFQLLEEPVGEIDISKQDTILGMHTVGIVRNALWCELPLASKDELEASNCPYIVEVFGQHSKIDGRRKNLVMSMNLKRFEEKEESNPASPTDIILQVAKGMFYLDEVVEADRNILTPSNILVKCKEDGNLMLKIAAFHGSDSETHFQRGEQTGIDVFSFGRVCKEILERRGLPLEVIPKPVSMLIDWCLDRKDHKCPRFVENVLHATWGLKEMILTKSSEEVGVHELLGTVLVPAIPESDLIILSEHLGIGSYGTVRKALWRGKKVALKEFSSEEDFEDEYKIFKELKATDCSHIVQLLGHTGRKALVLEFMDEDLKSLIKKRKRNLEDSSGRYTPFSLKQSIDIMLQIAKGLRSLHAINVVHRDIKPANILMKNTGTESFCVKLADFGISKQKFDTGHSHTDMKGTKYYMAPEMSGGTYSRKVDVYSFGIVCLEILTGKPPYNCVRDAFLKYNLYSYVLGDLCNIIRRCVEDLPDRRPTFEEICLNLNCLKERTVEGSRLYNVSVEV